jgi:hypothetical protein
MPLRRVQLAAATGYSFTGLILLYPLYWVTYKALPIEGPTVPVCKVPVNVVMTKP